MQGQPCRFLGAGKINLYLEKHVYPVEDVVASLEDAYSQIKPYGVRNHIILCKGNNIYVQYSTCLGLTIKCKKKKPTE